MRTITLSIPDIIDIDIADTTCLIILSKINELRLLSQMYSKVFITAEIASEFGTSLPEWIEIAAIKDDLKQKTFEIYLGKGEASAIAP